MPTTKETSAVDASSKRVAMPDLTPQHRVIVSDSDFRVTLEELMLSVLALAKKPPP